MLLPISTGRILLRMADCQHPILLCLGDGRKRHACRSSKYSMGQQVYMLLWDQYVLFEVGAGVRSNAPTNKSGVMETRHIKKQRSEKFVDGLLWPRIKMTLNAHPDISYLFKD
jgi:hypothetical protein